jgi:hypothetical protein
MVIAPPADVAADVVRVVGGQVRRRLDAATDDEVTKPWGEPFDLGLDGVGHVVGRPCGDVAVTPGDVAAGRRPGRVPQRRLADEHERPGGVPAAVRRTFRRGDLLEAAGDVNGSRPAAQRVGPWDRAFERPVDLECGHPVLPPAEATPAAGHGVPGDVEGGAGHHVEQVAAGRR